MFNHGCIYHNNFIFFYPSFALLDGKYYGALPYSPLINSRREPAPTCTRHENGEK